MIGGTGVRVKGRLIMETPRSEVVFECLPQNLRPADLKHDPNRPPSGFGFFCRPDGSFVCEDIPAGRYVLEARIGAVKDRNNPEASLSGYPVGKRNMEVVIPDGQEEEFDLGDVVITVKADPLPFGVP